jgi:hypothetical protein
MGCKGEKELKIGLKRLSSIFLVICLSLLLTIFVTGCGGASKSSSSAPPKERVYGIENPNGQYDGLSSEERHQLLFENLGLATEGTIVPLALNGGYEVLFAYVDHDLNFHTNPQSAKVTKVTLELGKPDGYEYDSSMTLEAVAEKFNINNRSKWMYGPYESTVDRIILTLEYDNPILNRHLDAMSYNYPIEITTVSEDKPLLKSSQMVVNFNGQRPEYSIYEWQAIGDHRFRLAVKKDSAGQTDFDTETFINSTFE